jgi:hypothetical protein
MIETLVAAAFRRQSVYGWVLKMDCGQKYEPATLDRGHSYMLAEIVLSVIQQ